MPTPAAWSRAFARQARADLDSFQVCCVTPAIPDCHRLHLLQMACEKLAKSFLCASGSDPAEVQSSHAYTAKLIPVVVREEVTSLGRAESARLAWVGRGVRPLARQIELLSPSVDGGGTRPSNCEYPWADAAGRLHVPADEHFPNLSALDEHLGTVFLKLIRTAIDRLANE